MKIEHLKNGDISEKSINKLLISYVKQHPQLAPFKNLIIHIPNEGKRYARYGLLLKALGVRPGVSDLFIAVARHDYHGAWIELKSENGKLSPQQIDFQKDMNDQNYFTYVCWSIDEAIKVVEWYLLK